jgi:pectate lyase
MMPNETRGLSLALLLAGIGACGCDSSSPTAAPGPAAPASDAAPDVTEVPDSGGAEPDPERDAGIDNSPPETGGFDAGVGPPFPGAIGWGAKTPGGRGGQVIRVTTLAINGPGSLTNALAATGPRIIVFEVGGVIDLSRAKLIVRQPYVTIAGQTAPSPGITIIRGGLQINTHDVVVQHLRVRAGEAGMAKTSGWEIDSISTSDGAYNVVIDHCSATWGTDENLSASGSRFLGATPDDWRKSTSHAVTFSNNIIAEGLSQSTHSEGEHSKGGLIHDNVTDMAIVNNLYFSNMERHPLFKGGARGIVANNYIANPGKYAMAYALNVGEWGTHPYETGQMSIVGNVFMPGPSTPADVPMLRISGAGQVLVYLSDNVAKTTDGGTATLIGGNAALAITADTAPTWPEGFVAMPADRVAEYIRANVGARPWDRDAIDSRIVEQALAGEGAILNSEQEVGGYPTHEPTNAPFNPDDWDLETMTRRTD